MAKLIVQALVLSRLDYCNFLLIGSAEYQMDKLQRIKNMGSQVIQNLRSYDHVTATMHDLHWLKIREHIFFKIALLVYKYRTGLASKYLSDLLPTRTCRRSLRSASLDSIPSAYYKGIQCTKSSFRSVRPVVWNSLPVTTKTSTMVESFKSSLKTVLFDRSYDK